MGLEFLESAQQAARTQQAHPWLPDRKQPRSEGRGAEGTPPSRQTSLLPKGMFASHSYLFFFPLYVYLIREIVKRGKKKKDGKKIKKKKK